MPSYWLASPRMSGICSNGASGDLRTMSSACSASKPDSVAAIVWSAPRGTVASPGVTSMRYGAAASTPREMTNSADSA
jgi:hypothetical protein